MRSFLAKLIVAVSAVWLASSATRGWSQPVAEAIAAPSPQFQLGPPVDAAASAPTVPLTPRPNWAVAGPTAVDEPLGVVPAANTSWGGEDFDLNGRPYGYQCFDWHLLPQGLIYRPYLAGAKESRFRSVWNHDPGEGDIWDISLGGQVGLVRFGSFGDARPEGFQVSMEGAGLTRLNRDHNNDVDATDYRFGLPVTWGDAIHQVKFGYYHLSSHVGDEFLIRNPGFNRRNYSRDVLILGHSYYLHPDVRLYGEVGYAFSRDVSEPWETQFGVDYAPSGRTGGRGAPFVAVNGHLREEVDFGGNVVLQAGWAWRRSPAGGLLRTGLDYYNGKNDQFSFFNDSEQKVGYAIWYDY